MGLSPVPDDEAAKKWLPINDFVMGEFSFVRGEAFHNSMAKSCTLSNSGNCDKQERSYNDATAPIDLQRKQVQGRNTRIVGIISHV